jgi:HrpA-like RNA helicase
MQNGCIWVDSTSYVCWNKGKNGDKDLMTGAFIPGTESRGMNVEGLNPSTHELGNFDLPIAWHRAEIETAIRDNSVVIIVAPTGSGKTTQVPQFAREMCDGDWPAFDEIIVTQPRIVAARTVSERVSDEITNAGRTDSVGYYTSKERTPAPQRQQDIAFLTDGKAAAQLLHQSRQPNPTTKRLLIIDEVHEWNLNIEQLIAIATEKTDPRSEQYDENLKVVIMSATMDAARLQKHFEHSAPPVINVEVPTYPVTRSVSNQSVAVEALYAATRSRQKVLAFLPGKREIAKVAANLKSKQAASGSRIPVIPLHGQQTAQQQRKAFDDYDSGVVIATTNAAETSLTVPGAAAVIDSGEVRLDQISYKEVPNGSEGLYLGLASQANLSQHAGRVGRTGPGQYILCSPDGAVPVIPHEDRPEYATPAMERTRLDSLILGLAATGHTVNDFRFFHSPPDKAVEAAQARLHILGAITAEGEVTSRGLEIDKLPLDPQYACMIAFAYEKGYSDEVKRQVLDIAAIMQLGGILKRSPHEQNWRELLATDVFGDVKETDSDFIAQLEAYIVLTNAIDRQDWAKYDILEYAASSVEQGRESLARSLNMILQPPTLVAPENRQLVLTCINAGQLNQLWRGRGDSWRLENGKSSEYELADSSVVRAGKLGSLATGALFTLGLRHKTIDSIQNVNRVLNLESLEQAAGHLVTDVVDESSFRFDLELQQLVACVERKLGDTVLRSFERPAEVALDSPEAEALWVSYCDQALNIWSEQQTPPKPYSPDELEAVIQDPQRQQYGTYPQTSEPLYAWLGGKGKWCRTKDIAVASLEAAQRRLERAPREAELRDQKEAIQKIINQLVTMKNQNPATAARVKKLHASRRKMTKQQWLEKAEAFLQTEEAA